MPLEALFLVFTFLVLMVKLAEDKFVTAFVYMYPPLNVEMTAISEGRDVKNIAPVRFLC